MTVKMSLNDMNSDKENVYTILEGITSVSACIKSMDEGVPSRDIAEILVDSSKVSGGGVSGVGSHTSEPNPQNTGLPLGNARATNLQRLRPAPRTAE